jgi:hypothetical protein
MYESKAIYIRLTSGEMGFSPEKRKSFSLRLRISGTKGSAVQAKETIGTISYSIPVICGTFSR